MPVVDASVTLKWFVNEPDSPAARALLDAHILRQDPLIAPDLMIYEVVNALLHNPRFTESDIRAAAHTLYDLEIELVAPTVELVETTIRLASRYKLTFYDALYAGVAHQLGTVLIAADRKLHRQIGRPTFVRLLH